MSKVDPTNTTTLRNALARELRGRFAKLSALIEEYLRDLASGTVITNAPYSFPLDPAKIEQFERWLNQRIQLGILSVSSITGTNPKSPADRYIESAFKRGVGDAYTGTKGEVMKRGDEKAGRIKERILPFEIRQSFINAAFLAPIPQNRLQLLYTRSFTGLKGITDEMSKQMSNILASAMAEGKSPLEAARQMKDRIDKIGKTRATTLARTEIIRAHAEGTLDGFELLGVEDVAVQAEWTTARDDKVCPLCAPRGGQLYSLQEARGLLPRHPNCRCAWAPYVPPPE